FTETPEVGFHQPSQLIPCLVQTLQQKRSRRQAEGILPRMQRVLTALVLIVVVLAILSKAPIWLLALVVGAVALLAAYEYLGLVAGYQFQPMRVLTLLLIALTIGNSFFSVKLRGTRIAPPTAHGWRILLEPLYQYQIIAILASLAPLILLIAALRKQDLRSAL